MQEPVLLGQRIAVCHLQNDMTGREVGNADPQRVHHLLALETFAHARVKIWVPRIELCHIMISLLAVIRDEQS